MSSFHASSDNQSQSACSMHSEPQPPTWRAERVVQTDSQSQEQVRNQLLDNKNLNEEFEQPDVTDVFKKNPNSSNKFPSNSSPKDTLVAPPKLSFTAFLSPMKSDFSSKQSASVQEAKLPEKLRPPQLSLSFPLLSRRAL